jgi:hypothetical protein
MGEPGAIQQSPQLIDPDQVEQRSEQEGEQPD